ncbi:unnamed protein product, partial [Mesorhabditis belari]|uniref:Uncharacterized protein n=1 Tax=Mesorhabditis belari TaxID=2138241 RepID=A0AAF3EBD2_9BILA
MGLTTNFQLCQFSDFRVQLPDDGLFYSVFTALLFVPTLVFVAIISTAFVINIGVALVLQGITFIFCLAWFLPTAIFCFATAFFLTKVARCTLFLLTELEKRKTSIPESLLDDTITAPKTHAHEKLL